MLPRRKPLPGSSPDPVQSPLSSSTFTVRFNKTDPAVNDDCVDITQDHTDDAGPSALPSGFMRGMGFDDCLIHLILPWCALMAESDRIELLICHEFSFVDSLIARVFDWLIGWLTTLIACLFVVDWLIDWLIDGLVEWMWAILKFISANCRWRILFLHHLVTSTASRVKALHPRMALELYPRAARPNHPDHRPRFWARPLPQPRLPIKWPRLRIICGSAFTHIVKIPKRIGSGCLLPRRRCALLEERWLWAPPLRPRSRPVWLAKLSRRCCLLFFFRIFHLMILPIRLCLVRLIDWSLHGSMDGLINWLIDWRIIGSLYCNGLSAILNRCNFF